MAAAYEYAAALINAAANTEAEDGAELKEFARVWQDCDRLRFFMQNPAVSVEVKKDTIAKIAQVPAVLFNFLCLLADKGRLELLPEISRAYDELMDERNGVLRVTVYTARELTDAETDALRERYAVERGTGAVKVINYTDPSLLGGVRVQIGDQVTDDTLLGRLNALKTALEI
jgi:F-type H+-transporting ATPase subunit delta